MQVYFSHSYRDVAVNGHFLEHFVDEEIPLQADQKTDVWCIAKLERYLRETTGFVSIIPCRPTESDPGGYSPYIGQELSLARRARVPRLLFVDDRVLGRHPLDFPEDAVPFNPEAFELQSGDQAEAIRAFAARLETAKKPASDARPREAAVVAGKGVVLREAGEDVAEVLRRAGYQATVLNAPPAGHGLEDIRLLETLWASELCVFLFGPRVSDTHVALAMAHAHAIPSVRLLHEAKPTDVTPTVSGLIRWQTPTEMLIEFNRQLRSYLEGLVSPVELARSSTAPEAARAIGTMRWQARADNLWDVSDGPGLVAHVHPEHTLVNDEVGRARAQLNRALGRVSGREGGLEVCSLLYDGIRRRRFAYEWESTSGVVGAQAIRTPTQIAAHRTATCLDLACLFASLLEAAHQNALVIVLESPGFAHALAGYRVRGEPAWDNQTLGDLRGAIARGDAVLFEATGAAEADAPVGEETAAERETKLLGFMDAQSAAERMLKRPEVQLRHFIDVRTLRAT